MKIKKINSNNNFKNLLNLLFVLIILNIIPIVNAIPPLPTEFYGRVIEYNFNASVGGVVTAYDSAFNLCGTFTIQNEGMYGVLTCNGDDPETSSDEGAITNDNITFKYNNAFVTIDGDSIWEQGVYKQVNLTYPVVFCGDLFCDALHENSFTCLIDCPNSTTSPNTTTNSTTSSTTNSSSTSGSGSGSSSSSSSGGGSSVTPRSTINLQIFNFTSNFTGITGFECIENWTCDNWTQCPLEEIQNRTCFDRKRCGTTELKPAESQKCVYTPTCSDNIRNGLEEGVDCGGLCKPCISCFDGVQNCHDNYCEEDVDCGGGCSPCNTCFDGIKNCHDGTCEEGPDCGKVCNNICPETQKPIPIFVCKKDINPINNEFIIFFAVVAFAIVLEISYNTPKIIALKRGKVQKGIERARKIRSLKIRTYLFITIIIFIAIILYLYYYMFVLCENDYKYVWWLILALLLLPFIIHAVIKSVEYNEKKKEAKLKALLEAHQNQIKLMINIENESNVEKYNTVNKILTDNKDKIPDNLIKQSLISINRLLEVYSNKNTDLIDIEKEEINSIKELTQLINSNDFKELSKNNKEFANISTQVNEIIEKQEEKKKLYDELKKIKSGQSSNQISSDNINSDSEKADKNDSKDIKDKDTKDKDTENSKESKDKDTKDKDAKT